MEKVKKLPMTLDDFKEHFHIQVNEQQEIAMCRIDGPTLLLAVPGSGKTTVIVSRTGYMLYCGDVRAENILNLTFSVAAAHNMEQRFYDIFGDKFKPTFSTIHSFCLKVIRYCKDNWGICVPQLEPNNEKIIRRVLGKLTDIFPSKNSVREIQGTLTLIKNKMLSDDDAFRETRNLSCLGALGLDFMSIYKAYEKDKDENGLIDFDDQLTMAYELLTEYPDALEYFQNQYRHISVDEAQDTSKIQHEIIRMLALRHSNLFMVGDDDQSIYRFRGAEPSYLLEFEHIYRDASILHMNINYRSDKKIIEHADRFIQENRERFPKHLVSNSAKDGIVNEIGVFDISGQYDSLYRLLLSEAKDGNKTVAVLYRNNDSVLPLVDMIIRKGNVLKVQCKAEPEVFFTSPLIDNLITILRFACYGSGEDFMKIYYRLGLFLNKKTAAEIVRSAKMHDIPILQQANGFISPSVSGKYTSLLNSFSNMKYMTPENAINVILDKLDYADQVKSESEFSRQKLDILLILSKPCTTIKNFLQAVEAWKAFDLKSFVSKSSNVTLSSIHSAKGLEFDHVIILDATDVILPNKSSYKDGIGADYEQEARLFYVAATRAKHQLTFLNYDVIFGKSSTKSRFIKRFLQDKPMRKSTELESVATAVITSPSMKKYEETVKKSIASIKIDNGARVFHDVFGTGIVQNVLPNGIILIDFEKIGVKKLMLNVCIKNGMLKAI